MHAVADEAYQREDLAEGVPATPEGLLQWAEEVAAAALSESVFRNKEGRVTLRFSQNGGAFFLKLHRGIGWGEVIKNLLQGRLPVVGAGNEYRAVRALEQLSVDTLSVAAFASQGVNPATRHSMIGTGLAVQP